MAQVHAEAFDKPWRDDEFEDLLDGEGIYGFLAAGPDETPLGVILCRVAAGEVEVLTLGVAAAARRRGVARALLAVAMPAARDLGAAEAFLEVAVDNSAAIALYDAAGFRQAGLRKAYYDRRPAGFTDALVMRLDLGAAAA
ncbi:MAG TPA: GNAT family N-acetyltransferase [Phenylobacterium sp.]|uniref:GNAT family N-acetyltransferase n=1 Tax=Phenylobacterium sp. TaxID=1871053 RepID=UPI002C49B5CD|nr:GNAT family N-acetyltransferase [Phenylobacterium sp.]HXA37416.1 GNAT family N-acetyltransferase [Phenylobacterium sp.]